MRSIVASAVERARTTFAPRAKCKTSWHAADVRTGASDPPSFDDDNATPELCHTPTEDPAALFTAEDGGFELSSQSHALLRASALSKPPPHEMASPVLRRFVDYCVDLGGSQHLRPSTPVDSSVFSTPATTTRRLGRCRRQAAASAH
jgi:hypothetical protein